MTMDQPTNTAAAPTPQRQSRPIEWRRAWTALRALINDSERTDQVFEIIDALSGNSWERAYERFCAHPEGRRILIERPSLLDTLSDREALRAMPAGSFGRAYSEFMDAGQLTADGLIEADNMAAQKSNHQEPLDDDQELFATRTRDMHDLWHVLTGYGRDEAGEAANLAFTFAQLPNPGFAFIVLAGAVIGPKDLAFTWQRYLYRAWQRGRQASFLPVARYEELLPLPLDDVRRLLQVQLPSEAHPGGIIAASRDDDPESANRNTLNPAWRSE